jgi:hypothetical protein
MRFVGRGLLLCFVMFFGRTQAQTVQQSQLPKNKSHNHVEQDAFKKNSLHTAIKAYKQFPTPENARQLLALMPTTRDGWNKLGESEDRSSDDIGDLCDISVQIIPDYPEYAERFLKFAPYVTGEYGEYVGEGLWRLMDKRLEMTVDLLGKFSVEDRNAALGLLELAYAWDLRVLNVHVKKLKTKNAKMISMEIESLLRDLIKDDPRYADCKAPILTPIQTQFLKYVQLGEINKVRSMLSTVRSVNFQDDLGFTPLMYCTYTGNKAIAELLLKKGADTTIKNCYGDTAKDIALIYNQKWFLKQVREKPGDSNNSGDTI